MHPVTVKTFAEFTGMSERQAKYWRKGWANPVTRVMLEGGHVKPYQAARLVDEWEMEPLALISIHVMEHGWELKDAELAILQVHSVGVAFAARRGMVSPIRMTVREIP